MTIITVLLTLSLLAMAGGTGVCAHAEEAPSVPERLPPAESPSKGKASSTTSPDVRLRLPPRVGGHGGRLAAEPVACIRPEQRHIEYRDGRVLCGEPIPPIERRVTVDQLATDRLVYYLTLDEAVAVSLANADVIRIVTGNLATNSGSTVYDAAITNTQVDQSRGRFDPVLSTQNTVERIETAGGILDILVPEGARIDGVSLRSFRHLTELSQTKAGGGTASVRFRANPRRTNVPGAALDPETSTSLEMGYVQPLLRGRGIDVNQAPIVISRISTERSLYQIKAALQQQVTSLISAYWSIVFARTDLWARRQQVEQLQFAYDYIDAQMQAGFADIGDAAQARVSLETFRAGVIAAEADLLNREEALFSVMGFPPGNSVRIVPSTPPSFEKLEWDWDALVRLAEANRPDVVQQKLQLEADNQQLLIAENSALPQLDASALYRLNGLAGQTPTGDIISVPFGDFSDWQIGVNMSVPLGLRADRAGLREIELILARDKVNLEQQVLTATHEVALSLRNLDQFYRQYEAFRTVRAAAQLNLQRRFDVFQVGGLRNEQVIYLNVLQAVTDWGNAVSSEALAVTQFNSELAQLAVATGTILADHGIMFSEESYESVGPKLLGACVRYPEATPPSPSTPRYKDGTEPAEDAFDLESKVPKPGGTKQPQPMPTGELEPPATVP